MGQVVWGVGNLGTVLSVKRDILSVPVTRRSVSRPSDSCLTRKNVFTVRYHPRGFSWAVWVLIICCHHCVLARLFCRLEITPENWLHLHMFCLSYVSSGYTINRKQSSPIQSSAQTHMDLGNSAMEDSLQFQHRNPPALSIQDWTHLVTWTTTGSMEIYKWTQCSVK
jgi:hypothetical protein